MSILSRLLILLCSFNNFYNYFYKFNYFSNIQGALPPGANIDSISLCRGWGRIFRWHSSHWLVCCIPRLGGTEPCQKSWCFLPKEDNFIQFFIWHFYSMKPFFKLFSSNAFLQICFSNFFLLMLSFKFYLTILFNDAFLQKREHSWACIIY